MGEENISHFKKKCQKAGGIIVFEDEAAFRQDPTLFRSWCRRGGRFYVLTYGQRNTQHVYGAISAQDARFISNGIIIDNKYRISHTTRLIFKYLMVIIYAV